ncbi:MAG: hypothetical protein J4G05_04760 [Chlorobi bacterium]|nr:hypothetical protein [Chlorobiota bacterium]
MMEVEGLPTQVLMTPVVRPHILLLSSALFDGGKIEEERVIGKLLEAIESIGQRSKPIDIRKLQDSIIKASVQAMSPFSGEG